MKGVTYSILIILFTVLNYEAINAQYIMGLECAFLKTVIVNGLTIASLHWLFYVRNKS